MSLVEGDKQALASEMEHESQITRSIRHSCVQEWLRASPAHDSPTFATAARDSIPFPASPVYSSSSVLSSPHLTAAPPASSSAASPVAVAVVRPSKRKSVDDGYPYKRQAMSPLGLRAQIAIGRRGGGSGSGSGSAAMMPRSSSSSSRSNPSSPQMMARPVALPVSHLFSSAAAAAAHHSYQATTAGACPSSSNANMMFHGVPAASASASAAGASLSPGLLGSRGRSRSGTSMAVLGSGNMSGFSRLNINDHMDDEP
ncbi:hypothetical protein IWW38_006234 [Coemansia aciculifera]|uniref:Uncharacterized protein n=1 Tax=Coemansia aciculifera TaxID=417176 RepID=A0ACC1LSW2_9FUNG|nr:hypothetical protein IWW38_006234 [Coemansia aciculifera]